MWHIWERGEVYTGLWWGNLKKRDRLKYLDVDGTMIFKYNFKIIGWGLN